MAVARINLTMQILWIDAETGDVVKVRERPYDDTSQEVFTPHRDGSFRVMIFCDGKMRMEKGAMRASLGDTITLCFDAR